MSRDNCIRQMLDEEIVDTYEEGDAFFEEQYKKAKESYKKAKVGKDEYRHCYKCGELMTYNSLAYHEGFHFDSCI